MGEEERKGGSGHIGKTIFSAGAEQLAVVAYVPEAKQGELSCEEWLKATLAIFNGEILSTGKDLCTEHEVYHPCVPLLDGSPLELLGGRQLSGLLGEIGRQDAELLDFESVVRNQLPVAVRRLDRRGDDL